LPDALSSHANAIIQAGSLNMSTFLTTTTYYLLSDPSILEKATEEVRSTFTELSQIDNESLQLLTNLPAVIEEGLRLFPPTPFGASSRSHGATTVAGNFIPHGTTVSSCTRAITHNPLNFSSASAFLPQRWLPAHHPAYEKRFATDTLSASKPFGLGPQACPGIEIAYLEARVVLAKVLWAFDLEVDGEMEGWEGRVRWRGGWRLPNVMVRLVPVVREEGSEVLV
jgi:cytochrome P450